MKIEEYVDRGIVLAIGLARNALWKELDGKLKEEKFNFMQAMILVAIFFEGKKPITPKDLSISLQTSKANISQCLSFLENKGFVKRNLDPKDARSYLITISAEGKKMAVRLTKIIDKIESEYDKKLGRDFIQNLCQNVKLLKLDNS